MKHAIPLLTAFSLLLTTPALASSSGWDQKPYPEANGALPPNYQGNDIEAFVMALQKAAAASAKGEFETTAAYQARMASSPVIDPDVTYAFQMQERVAYDADKQEFAIGSSFDKPCKEYSTHSETSDSVLLCPIRTIEKSLSKREATNGFGAKFVIQEQEGTNFFVAANRSLMNSFGIFSKPTRSYPTYGFRYTVPFPINAAAKLKEDGLGVLLVGRVSGSALVKGEGMLHTATPSWPFTLNYDDLGLPFDIKKIIMYNITTGDIVRELVPSPDMKNKHRR